MKAMRILDIGMMLEQGDRTGLQQASEFRFRNRFIGNYLTRLVRKSGSITDNFNRVIVIAKEGQTKGVLVEDKFLKIEIPFNRIAYERATGDELPRFFSDMYLSGFELAREVSTFPYSLLNEGIEELRRNGYRNEWQAKSKALREIDVIASLFCRLTMDHFSLTLDVRRGEQIFFHDEILKTLPDEVLFAGEFEDIKLVNRQISVINKLKGRIFYVDWPMLST